MTTYETPLGTFWTICEAYDACQEHDLDPTLCVKEIHSHPELPPITSSRYYAIRRELNALSDYIEEAIERSAKGAEVKQELERMGELQQELYRPVLQEGPFYAHFESYPQHDDVVRLSFAIKVF